MSAAIKGVFECKYECENFNKNITYFICKMTWLGACCFSIKFKVTIGVAKAFVGIVDIMLVVIGKSGKEIYWLTKTADEKNNTV